MIYDENQNRWNCITNSGSGTHIYRFIEAESSDGTGWGTTNSNVDAVMVPRADGNFDITLPTYVEQNGNIFYINFSKEHSLPFPNLIINNKYTYSIQVVNNPGPDVPEKDWSLQAWTTIRCTLLNNVLMVDNVNTLFEDSVRMEEFVFAESSEIMAQGNLIVAEGYINSKASAIVWVYSMLMWMATGLFPTIAMNLGDAVVLLHFAGAIPVPAGIFTDTEDTGLLWSTMISSFDENGIPYSIPAYVCVPMNANNGSHPGAAFIADVSAYTNIGNISIVDKTITLYTPMGLELSSFTVPDYRVKQTQVSDNANYPLLLTPKNQNTSTALETTAYYDSGVYLNPSTNTITATKFNGTASKALTSEKLETSWASPHDNTNTHGVKTYFENVDTSSDLAGYVIEHTAKHNKPLEMIMRFNGNLDNEPASASGPSGDIILGAADEIGTYISADELRGNLDWSFVQGAPSPSNATITLQGGSGIKIGTGTSGNFTLNQSSGKTLTINHANSVTAGNFGDSGSQRTLSFGGTFKIPYVQYDDAGHITSASTITLTMPANPNTNTTYTIGTGDANGQIKVTPSNTTAYNVSVKGLGSAAFTDSSAYAPASHGTHLTLGTSSTNAFRGDYGNTAYTHSQSAHAPTNAQKNSDITKTEIEAKLTGNITTHTHSAYAEASHGNHVPTTQTADNAKFLRNDNTWATVTPANIGAAPASHGNHVPTTQAADNAKFLRNDNTWATVTPANIGAAPASHGTHLSLGTSSTTAFRGDYGNTAYTHSQSTHAPTNAQKNSDITKAEIEAKLTGDITSHTHSAYAPASHGTHVSAATVKSALGTGSGTTKFLREDGSWATPAYYTLSKSKVEAVLTGNITTHTHSYAPASHSHQYLSGWADTRDVATKPNDYNATFKVVGIKTPTASGISSGNGGSYSTLVGIRGWSDNSGGDAHELAFCGNGNLYHRYGATTSWNAWKQVWIEGDSITGAVWNDYAEYRESDCEEFGRVLTENGDDTLSITTDRLQPFAGISSDTWGFCQGETEKAKTPIAVAGRVLAYPYQNRDNYKPGDCVCSAPNGTVDIMTREEIMMYPDRIIGTVSCVPSYDTWGSGDRDPVQVNGRIWIKVK